MADTPTMAEVIRRALEDRVNDINVALPGRVESFNKNNQTADIKPLIRRVIRTRKGAPIEEELPVIPNIPVVFPRAGGYIITLPVQVGDTGQIIVNQRNIDRWREVGGADVNPGDQRCHDLSAAVFYPGLSPSDQAFAGFNSAFWN